MKRATMGNPKRNESRLGTLPWLAAVLLGLWASAGYAKSAAEMFREGLYAEEVEGNLDTAIGIYEQIVADTTAPKNLVAQALLREGMCYVKTRNEAKAREVLQKLVSEYPDQTEAVEKAKPILEGLGDADPASLMPPETLAYVEIGSPGQQVDTILNMLKGTPLENPFDTLSAKMNPPSAVGGQSPVQMINALLNPSMLAELKKVRGIGIGLQDLGMDTAAKNVVPAAIVVLFPGKSDALKGLLRLALTGFGVKADPVEGMECVTLGPGARAAFDDTVVILVTPSPRAKDLLERAVRQYKGRSAQPALASANKSFARISKQARQQNALTLWLNLPAAYARLLQLLPAEKVPPQLRTLDALVNLQGIDDILATLSLRETGVALEANIDFKPGYQSVAYGLIHSPPLSKDAFRVVPAEAVALYGATLGAAGTPQAQAASAQIRKATGLDLGPEIFGNIRQMALFLVPAKEAVLPANPQVPPIVQSLGVALTCQDLARTQQFLMTVLRMAKLVAPETQQPPTGLDRFEIALANGMKVFGYANEANQTLVLSLNPQLVEQSVAATKTDRSVLTGGPLQDALETVSPATTTLVVINVGAALQIAKQNSHFSSDQEAQQAKKSLDELIQACQKTTLRLLTNEPGDSFGIRVSLSDLPPLRQLSGPIAQLARMIREDKAEVGKTPAQPAVALTILRAARAPVIDGQVDDVWAAAAAQTIGHVVYTPPTSEADLSAHFQALYDEQALYLLVDVTDDVLRHDSAEYWNDDSVEIFLDAENNKAGVYGDKDYQYHFDYDDQTPSMGEGRHNKTNGVQYAFARTDRGYRLEVQFPWATLGTAPAAGKKIGLDIHVNDDDDGGDRDTKIMWFGTHDVAWQQPSAFGTADLAGLIGWWKLDESDGTKAADSSGNGHDATLHGQAQWQPTGGKIGGALALDGDADSYLEVADEAAFAAASGVTVAVWTKVTAFDKPWQTLVGKGEGAWQIQRNGATDMLEFACAGAHVPGDNKYGSLFGGKHLTVGEWHHLVGVYDGKKMSLYVDGALDAAQDAWGPIGTNGKPVLIGKSGQIPDRSWNGWVDDVRVYNYGLSEAQVQQLYREAK